MGDRPRIGFFCAYAPLALLDAAGFVPHRVLPLTDAPDQSGAVLHDNLCPHVKRVLDRALAGDLPDLAGVVFMNSCESMRRLADGWRATRPGDRVACVDLPSTDDDMAAAFLARQLGELARTLAAWGGREATADGILASARLYDELAGRIGALAAGRRMSRSRLQELMSRSVTLPVEESLAEVEATGGEESPVPGGVPVFLFGNVMPDPRAIDLLERCGCAIAGDSLCTGSHQLARIPMDPASEPFQSLAAATLRRPPCGRTVTPGTPCRLASLAVEDAWRCGARGIVAHVVKFCDPMLARLPAVRGACEAAGMPLLVLEGDCTLRSLGQNRTRVEAFVEMLQGGRP